MGSKLEHKMSEQQGAGLAENDLALLIEGSADAIFTLEPGNTVVLWSRGAAEVYGYSRDEILGKPVTDLFQKEGQDEIITLVEQVQRGERVEQYATVCRSKTDFRLRLQVAVYPLWGDPGDGRSEPDVKSRRCRGRRQKTGIGVPQPRSGYGNGKQSGARRPSASYGRGGAQPYRGCCTQLIRRTLCGSWCSASQRGRAFRVCDRWNDGV